ncbi:MAG: tetratricopeptide repeat protein [Pseudomonadota bacterium]
MADKMDDRPEPLAFRMEQEGDQARREVEPGTTPPRPSGEAAPSLRPRSGDAPYLSLVVTSRNDDHGGDMNKRMRLFIDDLVFQCRRTGLQAELIVVEWNPPRDRPRLREALPWPESPGPLTIRLLEVPPELHERLKNSDRMGLFQMIAKNVGLRRARGKFVLATNIDLVFSDELIDFLARRELNPRCFYRVDRYDVPEGVLAGFPSHEALLDYCRKNVIRVHRDQREVHANACGDFTLLSREKWAELKGYPELELWSIYIDGLLVHMAHAAGLRQVVLLDPMRVYHAEHKKGWAVEQPTTQEIPRLDYNRDYLPWVQKMMEEKRPLTPNRESWGLAGESIRDDVIAGPPAPGPDPALAEKFLAWIKALARVQKQLYFRDQTISSLGALAGLVEKYRPTLVVELGTLSGLSLRTWLAADPDVRVTAVDLSFKALYQSRELLDVDLSRVELVEKNILEVDFPALWTRRDRVLFFVDAHDLPGVPIMEHVLKTAVPFLPPGSVLAVDDLWFSPEPLDGPAGPDFFRRVFEREIDTLQCFSGYFAPYWRGGSFFGFPEVAPLLEWAARRRAELQVKGDKMVLVEDAGAAARRSEAVDFDPGLFQQGTGRAFHNPLGELNLAGREGGPGSELFRKAERAYAERDLQSAAKALDAVAGSHPRLTGALYGLAVCHARVGRLGEALGLLERELAQPVPHPRALEMKRDVEAWLDRMEGRPPVKKEVLMEEKPRGLTIFGLPKAFVGPMTIMQRNAVSSWTRLDPRPEIILLGDDPGTAELAGELGLIHIPYVARNDRGTPLVDNMFDLAQKTASHDILAYVSADIILTGDFLPAVNLAASRMDRFLMIGRRWDLDLEEPLVFDGDWEARLRETLAARGKLHAETGLDYFVFTRGLWPKIPPFAIGRCAWDNWLVYDPIQRGVPVIDAGEAVTAVHQNHDYSHAPGGTEEVWQGTEAQRNRALVVPEAALIGASSSAPFVLNKNGLAPRPQEDLAKRQTAVLVQSARALAAAGDRRGALAKFDQAIQLMGRFNLQAQGVHFMIAQVLVDIGRSDVAVTALQAELAAFPHFREARDMLATLTQGPGLPSEIDRKVKLGEELVRQGRLLEAEETLSQALGEAPGRLDARNGLAMLRWAQDRRQDAVALLRGILDQEPWHRAANWNLGRFLREAGLEPEARQVYQAYIQHHPDEKGMAEALRDWDSSGKK